MQVVIYASKCAYLVAFCDSKQIESRFFCLPHIKTIVTKHTFLYLDN